MAQKKQGITAQVGDSFLIFTETDGENAGKLGIFRGRAQIFVPYTELIQIISTILANRELCDREVEIERKRLQENKGTFAQFMG